MKLSKPSIDNLNVAYHGLLGRMGRVPDYCRGEDRAAVYDRVKSYGDQPCEVIGQQIQGREMMLIEIKFGSKPNQWAGYGDTLLEAWVYALLVAAGWEITR